MANQVMDKKTIVITLLVLACLVGVFYLYDKGNPTSEPIFCTQEAKLCPDGSYVGRTGPNCEFKECPNVGVKGGTAAALYQRILNEGIYITPLEVISDSRCPSDVVCIWAGEVSLKVKLEKGPVSKEVIIRQQTPLTFEGNTISLIDVTPENNSQIPLNKEDYRFTFLVTSPLVGPLGTISGTVTTSPTCPVERMPPEPQCAPRPYATSIEIREWGKTSILKTIKSDAQGTFSAELSSGTYELSAASGSVFPTCNSVSVQVKSGQNSVVDISCDSGIR